MVSSSPTSSQTVNLSSLSHSRFGARDAIIRIDPTRTESIQLVVRELTDWRPFTEAIFAVGPGQILWVLNDANRPEFGTVRVRAMVAA
jgi:hypothetical protein